VRDGQHIDRPILKLPGAANPTRSPHGHAERFAFLCADLSLLEKLLDKTPIWSQFFDNSRFLDNTQFRQLGARPAARTPGLRVGVPPKSQSLTTADRDKE
jgi:hypothetical protein